MSVRKGLAKIPDSFGNQPKKAVCINAQRHFCVGGFARHIPHVGHRAAKVGASAGVYLHIHFLHLEQLWAQQPSHGQRVVQCAALPALALAVVFGKKFQQHRYKFAHLCTQIAEKLHAGGVGNRLMAGI